YQIAGQLQNQLDDRVSGRDPNIAGIGVSWRDECNPLPQVQGNTPAGMNARHFNFSRDFAIVDAKKKYPLDPKFNAQRARLQADQEASAGRRLTSPGAQ
ncbi:hypothetical protein ACXYUI_26425, partial [Klebsiella pneumoniae]